MYYTYVLASPDGKHYIGSTSDLKRRVGRHNAGNVSSTKSRGELKLVYFEACLSKERALVREKYFKTGFGRRYLRNRI
ncbi:MAG: GIY-YIG nuclease family protein [Patescibacteria group bacterium]